MKRTDSHLFVPIPDSEAQTDLFLKQLGTLSPRPFAAEDTSVGLEFELQVAVEGSPTDVDLPQTIRESGFFRNTVKRAARGDLPARNIAALRDFLYRNRSGIWENSWVRIREDRLGNFARNVLAHDLLADKGRPEGGNRSDRHRFFCTRQGEQWLRLPVSYLLKLALADAIGTASPVSPAVFTTGRDLLPHFLSDNTSPEILSFTIPQRSEGGIGREAAREAARTFLIAQILVQYANTRLGLKEAGQRCLVYNAPHAPHRQKLLNEIVPDGFYRHLFMSPCLSGWDRGEEKHRYMDLCHRTLSRSQLNTIGKLKDAGIITNNLVVLPNTSNTCLANNGTHVSLGSILLSSLARGGHLGFTPAVEKYLGDLIIKIVEHFLPLFVTTYTAAPYRIDFADFHPEKVLGFLPHELDYTHLRMLWRRWKKKAGLRFLGHAVTPFGPRALDRLLARCLRLRGDLVPDFRLIDYLVTLLSTETCPALNGRLGNQVRLKEELTEMGVFDHRMSMYLLYRQRHFGTHGFCGFEGRGHSLFPRLLADMTGAIDLQHLVTAFAFRAVIAGRVRHRDIPDQPVVESERRQIFFAAAIGLPTFFVRADTPNRLLQSILARIDNRRSSRRYRGYIRVPLRDYRLALLAVIEADGGELIAELGLAPVIADLHHRLTTESATAAGMLTGDALRHDGRGALPLAVPADAFNSATETFYRTALKRRQTREGITVLIEDCRRLEKLDDPQLKQVMAGCRLPAADLIEDHATAILDETASPEILQHLLQIGLAVIHRQRHQQP